MTCPAGCILAQGHSGFHTTVPAIAEREDKPVSKYWRVGTTEYVSRIHPCGTIVAHAVDEWYCPTCNPTGPRLSQRWLQKVVARE